MDATRLRVLIDGALEAQRISDVADATLEAARVAANLARDVRIKEASVLKSALGKSFVIYGDKVVRLGDNADGVCVITSPLLSVPVVLPPPPQPEPEPPASKPATPLSGGSVPAKKPGGK